MVRMPFLAALAFSVVIPIDAAAKFPVLQNSDVPGTPPGCDVPEQCAYGFVDVVGMQSSTPGAPDAVGTFTMVLRDFARNPVAGSYVTLDLGECADLRLCTAQVPGQFVECGGRRLTAVADRWGSVTFTVVGAGLAAASMSGSLSGCIALYADGVYLTRFTAVVHDIDGAGGQDGVTATDLARLRPLLGAASSGTLNSPHNYLARHDYHHDGVIDARDLSSYRTILSHAAIGGGSNGCRDAAGSHPYCP